jgi:hypothetical protein
MPFTPSARTEVLSSVDQNTDLGIAKHALTKRGYVSVLQHQADEAKSSFARAIALDDSYNHAHLGLALSDPAQFTNHLHSALEHFESRQEKRTDDVVSLLDKVHLAGLLHASVVQSNLNDLLGKVEDESKLMLFAMRVQCSLLVAAENQALLQLLDALRAVVTSRPAWLFGKERLQ